MYVCMYVCIYTDLDFLKMARFGTNFSLELKIPKSYSVIRNQAGGPKLMIGENRVLFGFFGKKF